MLLTCVGAAQVKCCSELVTHVLLVPSLLEVMVLPASRLQMPSSQDALKLGMVDRLVPTEQLLPAAEQTMQQLLKVPDKGRQRTKGILRDGFAKEWVELCVPEVEGAWEMLASPEISSAVGATLQRLAGKKKAKL